MTHAQEKLINDVKSETPFGFKVDDNGVYWYDSKAEKHRRICARLDVVAYCRDADDRGDNWGILVRFNNRDNKEKRINFPMELFGSDSGADITKRFLRAGLEYSPYRDSKRKVLEYLQAHNTTERIGLVNKMGWHKDAFVLPERTIGQTREPILFYNEGPSLCKLSERGTLEEWKENVSKYCVDNPLAMFAVSAAFSAPFVGLLGQEIMGYHFYGDSSWGKSTLVNMACSVYGNPTEYKKAWRATDNGMESLAAAHSDMLLGLDEINQYDPRKLGDAIYMLGNGSGKKRANDRGGARDDLYRWCLVFLSNGEKTLEQYTGEAGKSQTAGMEMRFLEIRATLQESEEDIKRMGVFSNPHEFEGGAALSEHLKSAMAKYHGTAFTAFVTALVHKLENGSRAICIKELLDHMDAFRKKHISDKASGQVKRAALKFALVAWAGEYATQWGITGWRQGQAYTAASTCFKSWLAARGTEGNSEEMQMLETIRHRISKYGESRFKRWDAATEDKNSVVDSHAPITLESWGYRREITDKNYLEGDSSDVEYYVTPEAFKKDLCKDLDSHRVARLLRDSGALILTPNDIKEGRLTTKARLPRMGNRPTAIYRIRSSTLFGGDDQAEEMD